MTWNYSHVPNVIQSTQAWPFNCALPCDRMCSNSSIFCSCRCCVLEYISIVFACDIILPISSSFLVPWANFCIWDVVYMPAFFFFLMKLTAWLESLQGRMHLQFMELAVCQVPQVAWTTHLLCCQNKGHKLRDFLLVPNKVALCYLIQVHQEEQWMNHLLLCTRMSWLLMEVQASYQHLMLLMVLPCLLTVLGLMQL